MSTDTKILIAWESAMLVLLAIWLMFPSGRKTFRDFFTALHGFRYWPPRAILRNFKR